MLRNIPREERGHLRGTGVVDERINGAIAAQLLFDGADPGFIGKIGDQNLYRYAIACAEIGGQRP